MRQHLFAEQHQPADLHERRVQRPDRAGADRGPRRLRRRAQLAKPRRRRDLQRAAQRQRRRLANAGRDPDNLPVGRAVA